MCWKYIGYMKRQMSSLIIQLPFLFQNFIIFKNMNSKMCDHSMCLHLFYTSIPGVRHIWLHNIMEHMSTTLFQQWIISQCPNRLYIHIKFVSCESTNQIDNMVDNENRGKSLHNYIIFQINFNKCLTNKIDNITKPTPHTNHHNIRTSNSGGVGGRGGSL